MHASVVRIGERDVGAAHPCYVIAEIGLNHNGDMALAGRTIEAAAAAGADAVKFQNYRTEDFLSDRSLTHRYRSGGREIEEVQYDFFKRCELKPGAVGQLKGMCDGCGVDFISTPTSEAGVAELVAAGAAAIKNGSDYLGHLPLIAAMGRSRLPVILSTGMAEASDVAQAVEAFRGAGGTSLVLLHCVSLYPTPPAELNLRRMASLRDAFGCPAGFSDHSEGVVAAAIAASMGAAVIEKHFTLDRALAGPDHAMSSDPAELAALVQAIRFAEAALGRSEIMPAQAEGEARRMHRLSCVAERALPEGHRMSDADIAFRRPAGGLAPVAAPGLVGRTLRRAVVKGHAFSWADFQ